MSQSTFEAFTRRWKTGDRCRAAMTIFYDHAGRGAPTQVPDGAIGVVTLVGRSGVICVQWRGYTRDAATSPDSIEPEPS